MNTTMDNASHVLVKQETQLNILRKEYPIHKNIVNSKVYEDDFTQVDPRTGESICIIRLFLTENLIVVTQYDEKMQKE